jgi:lactoylglutathione lyase
MAGPEGKQPGESGMNVLINIDVDDLAKAIAFYENAFGLKLVRSLGEFAVEMTGVSSPVFLLLKTEGSKPSPACEERRHYRRHWTPVHLDFVVTDLRAAIARATTAGASQEGDVESYPWGQIAYLADPFGHGMCLVQFAGRGYDEIATD